MAMKQRKNVLLALGWHDHRLLRGIGQFAAEHRWHISSASITQEYAIPHRWRGDGILAWLSADVRLARFVLSRELPVVDFSLRRTHTRPRVVLDHEAAGRMAADHFLERGIRRCVYYSFADNWTFRQRGKAFLDRLAAAGSTGRWLRCPEDGPRHDDPSYWRARQRWLRKQLLACDTPLGVFAANGTHAVEVHEVCESAGLRVPEQVAIIGVEGDLLVGQDSLCALTTLDPNYEELGYRGAALLDRLMHGGSPPAAPIRIAPARIVVRRSTEVTSVTHPEVRHAVRYIADHLPEPLDVKRVARAVAMSPRGLHKAFVEHMGRTPGAHIRAARIEAAKRLLAETETKVEAVARLSGYPSPNTFFVAFRRHCGMTPAAYRKAARRAR
jgi:LacI family transcriptional regulator